MTHARISVFGIFLLMAALLTATGTQGRAAAQSRDALLEKRLEWFQDQKFGFMVHWGPYSQWGVRESWLLCKDHPARAEEVPNWDFDIDHFRDTYWKLAQTFYPMYFDAESWAELADKAGMQYFVFTTKHHDGFCMFDSELTDYGITSPGVAYHTHPNPDIAGRLFDAFRDRGFGIGVYFSKADWHSPHYWKPGEPAPDRRTNYDTSEEPERWEKFVEFVHGQIRELMTNYGDIEILWLDAGWVRPPKEDIRMAEIAEMARSEQPGLIIVDRTAGDEYENYKTPEQRVPKKPLGEPWETVMTMGESWSFKPYDNYKSTREIIHMLVDVVAKGGNLLLNVGPMANGQLPPPAVRRMNEIGEWMKVNGEGIYGTRPIAPYKEGKVALMQKGKYVYACYLAEPVPECGEPPTVPETVNLSSVEPVASSEIRLLGVEEPLPWQHGKGGLRITVPPHIAKTPPCDHAYMFRIRVEQ